MKRRYSSAQYAVMVAAVLIIAVTAIVAPPQGLSTQGFRLLGTLFSGVLLWLFVGVGWTNYVVLLAMMMIPGIGVKSVVQTSFGNDTAVFLVFCFMLAAALINTGLARRISIWFITNKLARVSPWWTITMYFTAVFILSLVLSSTTTFVIFLPIMADMLNETGYRSKDKDTLPAVMVLGTVICGQLANSATPISHAMSITGMNTYNSYTGNTIDFFAFCAVMLPIAVMLLLVWLFIVRFTIRPDVAPFKNLDFKTLSDSSGTMSKREIIAAVVYIIVLATWIIPGAVRYISPAMYSVLGGINQCYPPLIAVLVLNLIEVDNKPVLAFEDAFKSINWGTFVFIATIMSLGSYMSNPDIGVHQWFEEIFTPLVSHVSPAVFIALMCTLGMLMTNFISNAVALAVMFAIAMPLSTSIYSETINPMAMAILITASIQYSWATPASTPNAAVALDSGWISTKQMGVYGFITVIAMAVVFIALGIPLSNLLVG